MGLCAVLLVLPLDAVDCAQASSEACGLTDGQRVHGASLL